MGFDLSEFKNPTDESNRFIGKLVTRKWPKKTRSHPGIICYFISDIGEKFFLMGFLDKEINMYKPRETEVDVTEIKIGTTFNITYSISKAGWANWLTAEEIL